MDFSTRDIVVFALFEYSQYHSFNKLTQFLFNKYLKHIFEMKCVAEVANHLNGKLISIVLPQIYNNFENQNVYQLLQVLILSRKLLSDLKKSSNELSNYSNINKNYNHYKCMKWSYKQLNLLIASFASIAKNDKQFLELKTLNSFQTTFKEIFYKLKSLKVLSFLAIEPKLPIELLAVIINETFLWTEPTQLNVSIMRLHSRLISQFSNYVKDRKAFHTHMREDFIFDLNEVLEFLIRNFPSFIDYLTQCICKTQIDLIAENSRHLSQINDITDDQLLIDFLRKTAQNSSFLRDENQLIEFIEISFNECHCESSLVPTSGETPIIDYSAQELNFSEELSFV